MNIQYYGHSCFKITAKPAGRGQEEITVFFDPFDKSIGLRPPQGQADLVLISHDHANHNNSAALKGEPRIIDIPGEYSVKGINIIGIDSFHDAVQGKEQGKNTVFVMEVEEMKLCHLGDLGGDLTEKQMEALGGVNILMVPIGGGYTLDYKKAIELIKKIEPNVIIPMHYKMAGTKAELDDEKKFCAEIGNCLPEKTSKINIKEKDLENKKMETIVMGIE